MINELIDCFLFMLKNIYKTKELYKKKERCIIYLNLKD